MSVDLLSEVLTMVRLTGALIFRVDISGPWGIAAEPTLQKYGGLLPRDTNKIIAFHVVLEGQCHVRHAACDWFPVSTGQAVVITHGGRHDLADEPGRITASFDDMLGGRSLTSLRHARFKTGSSPSTSLLCGFLGCDWHAFEPLFHSLAPVFRVCLDTHVETLLRYAVDGSLDDRPGAANLRVRIAELLFMEALRIHIRTLPPDASGWLAGLRDPLVCRALQVLHEDPCRHWSVDALAAEVASSRSCLAARFRKLIGEPPMHYLTHLRMQLAARHLRERNESIERVAAASGYESIAAFQRAFKRHFDAPPGAWKRRVNAPQR